MKSGPRAPRTSCCTSARRTYPRRTGLSAEWDLASRRRTVNGFPHCQGDLDELDRGLFDLAPQDRCISDAPRSVGDMGAADPTCVVVPVHRQQP